MNARRVTAAVGAAAIWLVGAGAVHPASAAAFPTSGTYQVLSSDGANTCLSNAGTYAATKPCGRTAPWTITPTGGNTIRISRPGNLCLAAEGDPSAGNKTVRLVWCNENTVWALHPVGDRWIIQWPQHDAVLEDAPDQSQGVVLESQTGDETQQWSLAKQ